MNLFAPAIYLMNRLKYPVKFLLISLIFLIPSALLVYVLITIRNEAIDFGSKERVGNAYLEPLNVMYSSLMDYQRDHNRYLLGDSTALESFQRSGAQVLTALSKVDSVNKLIGEELEVTQDWLSVQTDWASLNTRIETGGDYDKLMATHVALQEKVLNLLYKVGDKSNLILDPDLDSYYLMDAIILKVPALIRDVETSRNLAASVYNNRALSQAEKIQLLYGNPGLIRSNLDALERGMQITYEVNNAKPDGFVEAEISGVVKNAGETLKAMLAISDQGRLSGDTLFFNTPEYIIASDQASAALRALYMAQLSALDDLLIIRIDAFNQQKKLIQLLVPIFLVVIIYLLVGFYLAVRKTVGSLDEIAQKLVSGNTDEEVHLDARDELAQVGVSFNTIGRALIQRNKEIEESYKQIREQQSQLIQSEKMASLGQMVAGIAHEVNTPLGFVRNNIELLERHQTRQIDLLDKYHNLRNNLINGSIDDLETQLMEVAENAKKMEVPSYVEKVKSILEESIIGIDRIQELVLDLKNFSRLDETQFKTVDLNEGIDTTLKIAHNQIKHKLEVHRDFTNGMIVECFPARLNQVFLNLITNAAQACDPAGELFISTKFDNSGGSKVAVLKFRDTGRGISDENMQKIFEPFFTTKPVGQGTGLGLSIAFKIIEQHKGSISVSSEVGKGTEFTITLPLRQSEN